MTNSAKAIASLAIVAGSLLTAALPHPADSVANVPHYRNDGRLELPQRYREWVYLSSGFDMSYSAMATPDHHMFDNVFVSPEAYAAFLRTGTWPDKTMLVSEQREAQSHGSINAAGHFERDVMGLEVHVKDDARFKGSWAFFAFDPGSASGPMVPLGASCYTCHSAHAAVDTTFVQFYPTLLPIAKRKATLSAAYLRDGNGI